MGGFNQGLGNFNEHLDENAMMTAVQQKALGQQTTSAAQSSTGGSALQMQQAAQAAGAAAPQPREVSTVTEELLQRPAQDVYAGLKSFLDFNAILGINPEKDDPQTQMRKKQILNNWQKLTQEQQQVAKMQYQENLKKKQQEEQEKQVRQQQLQQQKAQQVVMPSSPKKGPVGPSGSGKQRAVTKLEQDRKTLSGPASAG